MRMGPAAAAEAAFLYMWVVSPGVNLRGVAERDKQLIPCKTFLVSIWPKTWQVHLYEAAHWPEALFFYFLTADRDVLEVSWDFSRRSHCGWT